MPDLLFITGEYPPDVGGVGDYTAQLRTALDHRGWPSRVLSRQSVRRWDARSLVHLVRRAPRTGIVHIQYQPAAFDLLGDVCLMPSVLHKLRPRVHVLTTFHDSRVPYLFPKAGRLRRRAVELLAHTSDAVVAADEGDLVALGGPMAHRHLVPIGSNVACAPPRAYDRAAFRSHLGLGQDELAIVYFGLLNASKGLDVLLEAFVRVSVERPTARLLLLGAAIGASDPTNAATARAVENTIEQLGRRIVRPGFLEPALLSAHLLAGDVALLPFADGASPRRGSLLACAAHELPIVSTFPLSPAVADAVLAVEAAEPTAMAAAVLRVATDRQLNARLRSGSRELTRRTSWSKIADAHLAIYTDLDEEAGASMTRIYTREP